MIVYLNGHYLPDTEARVSMHDRGFLYGDGLFETIRSYGGSLFLWPEHLRRLEAGAAALRLALPLPPGALLAICQEVLARNSWADAMLRLTLTRGPGPRGYSPRGSGPPTLCVAAFPPLASLPETFSVVLSRLAVPAADPLAACKHLSKVHHVLARAEADDAGADEALLADGEGRLLEATAANLFWIDRGVVCTPPLGGLLPGTTRGHVLNLCELAGIPARETFVTAPGLLACEGSFLTSCGLEIMEIARINGQSIPRSPLAARLKSAYRASIPPSP